MCETQVEEGLVYYASFRSLSDSDHGAITYTQAKFLETDATLDFDLTLECSVVD